MRFVRYVLFGVVASAFGCGDVGNGPARRPSNSDTPGSQTGGSGGSNGTPGTGGTKTTGGLGTGGSGSGGAGSGTGGNAGVSGSTGVGGSSAAGGSGGTSATGGAGGNGATGGGSTGGSGGATGGSGGATGGSGGSTAGSGGAGNAGGTGSKDAGAGGSGATGGSSGTTDGGVKVDAPGTGGGRVDSGVTVDAGRTDAGGPVNSNMWIAPNHPWYEWSALPADQVPWQHITHLGLGNAQPQSSGGKYIVGMPPGWGSDWAGFRDAAKVFAAAGHAASKKVFMMLGAAQSNTGTYDGVWNAATSSANIDAFADNVVSSFKEMQVDGVELDWEENINYAQLVALAQKIRARWADGLIFIDVLPLDDGTGIFAELAPAKDAIDAFMPMTFLAIPQWGGWILPIPPTPLYGYPGNGYSVDDNLKGWTAAGVPASKVIMGIGGFGSVWGDSNSDNTAPISPYITTNGNGGANSETGSLYDDRVVTQTWVKGVAANNPGRMVEAWDDVGKCSFWHAPATNDLVAATAQSKTIEASLIFYETPRSMTEKLNYAKAQGMRGMNFWTLSQTMDGTSNPILETVMP